MKTEELPIIGEKATRQSFKQRNEDVASLPSVGNSHYLQHNRQQSSDLLRMNRSSERTSSVGNEEIFQKRRNQYQQMNNTLNNVKDENKFCLARAQAEEDNMTKGQSTGQSPSQTHHGAFNFEKVFKKKRRFPSHIPSKHPSFQECFSPPCSSSILCKTNPQFQWDQTRAHRQKQQFTNNSSEKVNVKLFTPTRTKIQESSLSDGPYRLTKERAPFELTSTRQFTLEKFSSSKAKRRFRGSNGLTPQIVERWICDTLSEAQSDKVTEWEKSEFKSKPNSTLIEFGLDRNALKHKGVHTEGIDRIYRSLFVYSFGFYEMLYEILEHVKDRDVIIAQVWQVYGLLLEYCSRSEFKTTVSVLERKKEALVEDLNRVIHEKTNQLKQIEGNGQAIRDQFEETIINLTSEYENLVKEKERLTENNKLLDKQFTKETKMRLQFEHKINDLYNIYRELWTKHSRLITEKDQLDEKNKNLHQQNTTLNEEKRERLIEQTRKQEEAASLKTEIARLSLDLRRTEDSLKESTMKMEIFQLKKNEGLEELQSQLSSVNHLLFKCDNLQSEVSFKEKTQQKMEEEKNKLLKQLESAESNLKRQERDNEIIKFQLSSKLEELANSKPLIDLSEMKLKEVNVQLEEKENMIIHLKSLIKTLNIDLEVLSIKAENLDLERSELEKCVKKYKSGQSESEIELLKSLSRNSTLLKELEDAKHQIKQHTTKDDIFLNRFKELTLELQKTKDTFSNQMTSMTAKFNKSEQDLKRALDEHSELEITLSKVYKEKEKLLSEQMEMENDLMATQEINQELTFKNKQIAFALLKKETSFKEFHQQNMINISNLTDTNIKLEKAQRQVVVENVNLQEFKNNSAAEIEKIVTGYENLINKLTGNDTVVNGMLFEDALAEIQRYKEQVQALHSKLEEATNMLALQEGQSGAYLTTLEKTKQDALQHHQYMKCLSDQQKIEIEQLKQKLSALKDSEQEKKEQQHQTEQTDILKQEETHKLQLDELMKVIKALKGSNRNLEKKLKTLTGKSSAVHNQVEEDRHSKKSCSISTPVKNQGSFSGYLKSQIDSIEGLQQSLDDSKSIASREYDLDKQKGNKNRSSSLYDGIQKDTPPQRRKSLHPRELKGTKRDGSLNSMEIKNAVLKAKNSSSGISQYDSLQAHLTPDLPVKTPNSIDHPENGSTTTTPNIKQKKKKSSGNSQPKSDENNMRNHELLTQLQGFISEQRMNEIPIENIHPGALKEDHIDEKTILSNPLKNIFQEEEEECKSEPLALANRPRISLVAELIKNNMLNNQSIQLDALLKGDEDEAIQINPLNLEEKKYEMGEPHQQQKVNDVEEVDEGTSSSESSQLDQMSNTSKQSLNHEHNKQLSLQEAMHQMPKREEPKQIKAKIQEKHIEISWNQARQQHLDAQGILNPSDRYPTDKQTKKPKISNTDIAKIFGYLPAQITSKKTC